jgi:hypothetical protein
MKVVRESKLNTEIITFAPKLKRCFSIHYYSFITFFP